MNKLVKLLSLFFLGLIAGGCSQEEPVANISDVGEGIVTFNVNIEANQTNETPTRSLATDYHFSDGKSISVVKCYVYRQASGASSAPIKTFDISVNNLKGEIKISLPRDDVYDIVFLATSFEQTNTAAKMYYSTTERSLNIDYNKVNNNDEEMDCFYAVKTGVTSGSSTPINIELKRPLAQLNIGAKDYTAYDAAHPVKSTSVTVKGIYNKMTLMDGKVVGSAIDATFGASQMPANQSYPVAGAQYISMNYLLVNQRKLVDATITISHYNSATKDFVLPFKNIAVERNYQTNVTIKSLNN